MAIATVNPANGETLKTYDALGAEEIERRLAAAEATFRSYRTTSFAERARLMHRAAELLEQDQDEIGRVMTVEMGKPVKQARAEAAKCAKAMHWYADRAEDCSPTSTRTRRTRRTPARPASSCATGRSARCSP